MGIASDADSTGGIFASQIRPPPGCRRSLSVLANVAVSPTQFGCQHNAPVHLLEGHCGRCSSDSSAAEAEASSSSTGVAAAQQPGFMLAHSKPRKGLGAKLLLQLWQLSSYDLRHSLQLLSPTRKLKGAEAVKACEQLATGPLLERLTQLDKLVASRPGKFIAGDKLSIGDFAILNLLGMFKAGFWSGIPTDVSEPFTALKAYRKQVASEPGVKKFYEQRTDDVRVKGYVPDAA